MVPTRNDPPQSLTWSELLERASSTDEVLRITRDYLASWEPRELAALPKACKPPAHFTAAEELVDYSFTLVQHHCGEGTNDEGILRLARFFAEAARRVVALLSQQGAQRAADNDFEA